MTHSDDAIACVGGLAYDEAGRLLLVQRANEPGRGLWSVPGGRVEPGEDDAAALVREMWEETGLHVRPVAVRGVFSGPDFLVRYANGDECIYVMSVFACDVLGGQPRPDGVETLDVRYWTQAEAMKLPTPPWAHAILPSLFARTGPGFTPPTWTPPG